jgi:hypothetical protein
MIAFDAEERTGNDLLFVLFRDRQLEFALTYRAGQNIHEFTFHGTIITQALSKTTPSVVPCRLQDVTQ